VILGRKHSQTGIMGANCIGTDSSTHLLAQLRVSFSLDLELKLEQFNRMLFREDRPMASSGLDTKNAKPAPTAVIK
jgi:hypothetical protein